MAAGDATCEYASIVVLEIEDQDEYAIDVTASTTSTVWQQAVSLTVTPATSGYYLLMFHCITDNGQSTADCQIRCVHGTARFPTAISGQTNIRNFTNTDAIQYTFMHRQYITSSITFRLQFSSGLSGTSVTIKENRIYAFREDIMNVVPKFDSTNNSAKSTTDSAYPAFGFNDANNDLETSTKTLVQSEHVIFGCASGAGAAGTFKQAEHRLIDDTDSEVLCLNPLQTSVASKSFPFFSVLRKYHAAGSQKFKVQHKAGAVSSSISNDVSLMVLTQQSDTAGVTIEGNTTIAGNTNICP